MAVSTSTTITELIRTESIGAAAMFFESTPGVRSLVTVADISGVPTNTFVFPILDRVSAEAIAEGTDFTTTSTLDTTGSATATATEHAIRSDLTDYADAASTTDFFGGAPNMTAVSAAAAMGGRAHAIGMQKLQDTDITALFSAFNSSTGSNSGPLTAALFHAAVSTLNANDAPQDRRSTVLHPTQWQPLMATFDDASVFGRQGQSVVNSGQLGQLYGTRVFLTTAIATATVSSSTVYAGAVMHATAVGVVEKDGPMVGVQRDESERHTEVILVKKWGEVEYRGGATTSGRGGAGVYFYSNTTN